MNPLLMLVLVLIHESDVKVDTRMVGQPGKERQMRTQKGYYKTPGSLYPQKFKFTLSDRQVSAFPAGWYLIDPESFVTGDYDSLELSRYDFNLIPVPEEIKKLHGIGK